MFCEKCGKEIFDEAVICPNCGCPTSNYLNTQNQPKYVNNDLSTAKAWSIIGLVAGIFIPGLGLIVGLISGIIGLSKANKILKLNPEDDEAENCKYWSLYAIIVPLLLSLLYIVLFAFFQIKALLIVNDALNAISGMIY